MKKLLIAAAAVVGMAGVASAEQAPFLQGNYSANVIEAYDGSAQTRASTGTDYASQASAVNTYEADHGVLSAQTTDDLRSGQ